MPIAVFALVGLGIFIWCLGKKKGSQSTAVPPPVQPTPGAPQAQYPPMANAPVQGVYVQGQYMQPTPPPQYIPMDPGMTAYQTAGAGEMKPQTNVQAVPAEMEHQYHHTGTGAVEMEAGQVPQGQGQGR